MIAGEELPPPAATRGRLETRERLDDYVKHVMSFIDPANIKPFNVVLDAGNGMAGLVAPKLFARLPCRRSPRCASRWTGHSQPRSRTR